jgi:hypothetical protein
MNFNRRQYLGHTAAWGLCGLGHQLTALADGSATTGGPLPAWRSHAPRAKRVIFLFMNGGPSHPDLFDPKPALKKYSVQRPDAVDIRTERKTGGLLPSIAEFRPLGESGVEVSDLLPWTSKVIDEICVIRSVYGPNPTHTPASNFVHSGNIALTRPSVGAWVNYGLGSENSNMPGFVALAPGGGPSGGGATLWRSGFLPGEYGGTHIRMRLSTKESYTWATQTAATSLPASALVANSGTTASNSPPFLLINCASTQHRSSKASQLWANVHRFEKD